MRAGQGYVARRLSGVARRRFASTPVLMLEGPRSVGKSTLLGELAAETRAETFDFDDEDVLAFARLNPKVVTDREVPVFIDEYQREPKCLQWVKSRLNRSTEFGMFALAGSSSFSSLPQGVQALTGRLQRLAIMPFAQTEIDGTDSLFLARALSGDFSPSADQSRTSRGEYIDRVLRGGMPLALQQPDERSRSRWFAEHTRLVLERDAVELRRLRATNSLRSVLDRVGGQTGSILNYSQVASDLEISRVTAQEHVKLLEALFLVTRLPAWRTTALSRSVATPKIHIVDSGIGGQLLGLSRARLDRVDPAAQTEFGHLLESFVVQELTRHSSWLDEPVKLGHWRTRGNDEVDLIIEREDGRILAVEVKAGERVDAKSLAPLRKLRDRLGDQFIGGVVFYLGRFGYEMDDQINLVPLDRLWVEQ